MGDASIILAGVKVYASTAFTLLWLHCVLSHPRHLTLRLRLHALFMAFSAGAWVNAYLLPWLVNAR